MDIEEFHYFVINANQGLGYYNDYQKHNPDKYLSGLVQKISTIYFQPLIRTINKNQLLYYFEDNIKLIYFNF